MGKRIDRARAYADLLAALTRTGSVQLSLIAAGVSRHWAHCRRADDPAFDAAWRAAADAGQRALGKGPLGASAAPGSAFPHERPAGMVVIGSSGKGTIRLARERADRFTNAKRAVFLDQLRATCNVTAAAEAAGITRSGAYQKYHADRVFRGEWDSALAEGRVHLEMALIGAARAMLEGADAPAASHPHSPEGEAMGPPAITGMDAGVAVKLLQLHGSGRPKGTWVKAADPEATRREILAKIAAVKAARAWSGEEAGRTSP